MRHLPALQDLPDDTLGDFPQHLGISLHEGVWLGLKRSAGVGLSAAAVGAVLCEAM